MAGWPAPAPSPPLATPSIPSLELEFPSSKRMALSPHEHLSLNPITAETRPGEALLALMPPSVLRLGTWWLCHQPILWGGASRLPQSPGSWGVSCTLNLFSAHCCPSLGSHSLALWSTLCCCLVLVGQ